ncbi:helix-turn-helix domain-containing protein [Novilysobacter antarcticus]|uniref:helix-turn-helix domain-containing protein n=1 Tax=Novilysobacter antarcticus TaxID=2862543 RepID=UPI001C99A220|nr:helix-turn-helix transcriptional regulator [Lysobacter antarcticus]
MLDLPQFPARSIFAARLKEARTAAGLTQKELGRLAGIAEDVASTRINRYERGVHDCDSQTAQRLASALGIPLASLYAEDESVADAIHSFSRLSLVDRLDVLAHMRQRLAVRDE